MRSDMVNCPIPDSCSFLSKRRRWISVQTASTKKSASSMWRCIQRVQPSGDAVS